MRYFRKFCSELEKLKTNLEIVKACQDAGLTKLGWGSSRMVFALNDKYVIKIAMNKAGQEQNLREHEIWMYLDYDMPKYKRYYAKVETDLTSRNELFIVMQRLEPVKGNVQRLIKEVKGYYRERILNTVEHAKFAMAIVETDEIFDSITAIDLYKGQMGCDAKGNIKVLDYGLDHETWYTHYKTIRPARKEVLS